MIEESQMPATLEQSVTALLARNGASDPAALAQAIGAVYKDLRRIAQSMMRRERGDHTLQATALVNEALGRLWLQQPASLASRKQLIGLVSLLMRRVLVDMARSRDAQKRGDGVVPEQLTEGPAVLFDPGAALDVDHALQRLEKESARAAKAVEMRWFGGFTIEEIAEALDVSTPTIKRDFAFAEAWLKTALPDPSEK